MTQPEKIADTLKYWTHKVDAFPHPVAQFRMSQLIDYDPRLTEPARTVYRFLVGWYMNSQGDALASVRHIVAAMRGRAPEGAKHLSRSAVQRAIILLVDNNWLTRKELGKGRRGSRYVPVANVLELAAMGHLPGSVPRHRDTNDDSVASHATGTALSHATGTQSDLASHLPGQRPDYLYPPTGAVTGKEEQDCPPPADGLPATAAVQGGIDELYTAYGVRKEFAAARAAYEKLAPSDELHREMVKAAMSWRQAGGGIERMHLARWIREERYREDPKGERKQNEPIKNDKPSQPGAFTERRETFTIIEASVSSEDGSQWLDLVLTGENGVEDDMSICIESHNENAQQKGQNLLDRIVSATGLPTVDDTGDLVGAKFVRVLRSKFAEFEYERVAANDNGPFNDTVIVDDAPSKPKVRPVMPRFADIVARTKFEGWASKIGTAYDDDDDTEEAA
ncbi:hypothetical protein Amn_24220 [Aminobacter sp. Y103A]|uniref:hypothetical protein n=1 Tax=Aminobacter sp. Y103A TaxID=1870862 RepID=UPI0025730CF9|nr:hypothetical protein [Aminobacter sp. SS-2016]BBD37542.1 hypothetical protein Amn_24220 [Aminobacter sp. SS-2016]